MESEQIDQKILDISRRNNVLPITVKQSQNIGSGHFSNRHNKKHMKYLYICKLTESEHYTISYHGRKQYCKVYGIAFLDDDNNYTIVPYYHNNHGLTKMNVDDLKRILTVKYSIDCNTEICISKNMEDNDIVFLFLDILCTSFVGTVTHVDELSMYRRINQKENLVKTKHFCNLHKNKLFDALYKSGLLAFLPYDFGAQLSLMQPKQRRMQKICAIGIYYIYVRQYFRMVNQKYYSKFKVDNQLKTEDKDKKL